MEKFEHILHILCFEFNREAKAAEAPETYAPCMGKMPSEKARQENCFLVLRRIFLKLVTLHVQEDQEFDEDRLNTLINNDPRQCIREAANVMNCDHSTIMRHLHSRIKVQKSAVSVPHARSQNHENQRTVICASLLACRLVREQHRPLLFCIVNIDEKCLSANIRRPKE